jgi:hypothetical protein
VDSDRTKQERMPLRVKFLSKAASINPTEALVSFLPNRDHRVGEIEWIFAKDCSAYDWLVVYDDLPSVSGERNTLWEERLACPKQNTLLITSEPSTIKVYGKAFLAQFGHVLTSQEPWAVPHANPIFSQCGMIWFYGKSHQHAAANFPTAKTRDISTVCSSKKQRHTLHFLRHEFTRRLKIEMPDMEVFGHGHRHIQTKVEALDPFRYITGRKNSPTPFWAAAFHSTSAALMSLTTSLKKALFPWISGSLKTASKPSAKPFATRLTKKGYPLFARQDASSWSNTRCFPCSRT